MPRTIRSASGPAPSLTLKNPAQARKLGTAMKKLQVAKSRGGPGLAAAQRSFLTAKRQFDAYRKKKAHARIQVSGIPGLPSKTFPALKGEKK